MKAEKIEGEEITCKVLVSGQLYSRKGINIPKTSLDLESVTDRDLEILDFAIKQDIDAIGVSYVSSADDISKVKKAIKEKEKDLLIISKIERPDAVNNFDEILKESDGIMVARGDLGIETSIEKLPVLQKKLIQKTNIQGKPVITATQMLQSMTEDKIPTRAEVTDVSNAILDGTDAVMLSEETAIGQYPVKTVETMSKIARSTEKYRKTLGHKRISDWKEEITEKGTIKQAITHSIIEALGVINIDRILIPSNTGRTARLISRFKPNQWIIAFPDQKSISQQLIFSYGIYPICVEQEANDQDLINLTKQNGLVKSGDKVLLTSGRPIENTSGTNAIKTFTIS